MKKRKKSEKKVQEKWKTTKNSKLNPIKFNKYFIIYNVTISKCEIPDFHQILLKNNWFFISTARPYSQYKISVY